MNDLLREFFDLPQEGWYGPGYVARQILHALVELAVFVLVLAAIFGSLLLVWSAQQ